MVVIIAYQLYDVARSTYGMSVKDAAFQLGLLGLVQFLPLFLLTPVAGLVADKYDRRIVGAAAVGIDFLIALTLVLAVMMDFVTLPLLYVAGALHGTARVFVSPAISSIVPNVVPAELMPRAIAMSSIAWQVGSITGPALAGLLYASHHQLPYSISACLLAVSAITVLSIRKLPRSPKNEEKVHPLKQIFGGFTYVRNERFLLGCITLDLFAVLLGGAATALLPIFARDVLHVGAEGLGIMRAAPAIGAAAVALLLSFRPLATNVGVKMLVAVAVYGLAVLAFGLSKSFPLSLGILVCLGAADMVSVYVRSSLVQLNTPDNVRGRVSAISGLAVSASNELGEMQAGTSAWLFGAAGAVMIGGIGAIAITILWAFLFPELKNARTFAPQYRERDPVP